MDEDRIIEPKYDFLLILESKQDFNRAERIIYNELRPYSLMDKWCEITTNGTLYACEVPSPDRLALIEPIRPILQFVPRILSEPERIEEYKGYLIDLITDENWKWLLSKLQIINRNEFKTL